MEDKSSILQRFLSDKSKITQNFSLSVNCVKSVKLEISCCVNMYLFFLITKVCWRHPQSNDFHSCQICTINVHCHWTYGHMAYHTLSINLHVSNLHVVSRWRLALQMDPHCVDHSIVTVEQFMSLNYLRVENTSSGIVAVEVVYQENKSSKSLCMSNIV